jgi:exodeoxyribonuclease-3
MQEWLDNAQVDVLALQEVRAEREHLVALLGDEWVIAHDPATAKGRAGVAVATRVPQVATRMKL